MLQGGRLGGALAAAGAVAGVAGSGAALALPERAAVATALWSVGALVLAAAAWAILAVDRERSATRIGGWVALAGLLLIVADGALRLADAASAPLFPIGALGTVVGLLVAASPLSREGAATRSAAWWLMLSAAGLAVALVIGASPVAEIALAVFYAAWLGVGFVAIRPDLRSGLS